MWLWSAVDYEVGDMQEVEVRTRVRHLLFCKDSDICGEKNFTAKNRKNSPHSTLKDAGALR